MTLSPTDVLNAVFNELVAGDLVKDVPELHVTRTAPGTLRLDYGSAGRFVLTVTEEATTGAP